MANSDFLGMKDLYDVQLKATSEIEVAGRVIEVGEPLAVFSEIQLGNLEEIKEVTDAAGGKGNKTLITWETTKEIQFIFEQGVFSRIHLALMSNSKLLKKDQILVPKTEERFLESDSTVLLKHLPLPNTLFIYDKDGERVRNFVQDGLLLTFPDLVEYAEVTIVYEFDYIGDTEVLTVGNRLINSNLELSGKTKVMDGKTGKQTTGVLRIPRLRLISDLSIRLGKEVSPIVTRFMAMGSPVGTRNNEYVATLSFLDADIDRT